jgi:Holliday junction resolvase
MMAISDLQNRRSNERYKTAIYSASLLHQGLSGLFRQPLGAAVINFNRSGMAVCCECQLKVGEKIKILLNSTSEQVKDIYAVVRYAKKQRAKYFVGLQFVGAKDFSTAISNVAQSTLVSMEQVIKHQLA